MNSGKRRRSSSDSERNRRDWRDERERFEEERNNSIREWQSTSTLEDRSRESSPCPSVAIERVVVRNPIAQRRDEERREREDHREKLIENEKLRLRNRVEDIFPGSRMITGVLSDARWCVPCQPFNIGQCDIPEKMHKNEIDRQVRHICSICHYAAGVSNAHTARNCKLNRFLNHEVEKRREEKRQSLSNRLENERGYNQGRSGWPGLMAPPPAVPSSSMGGAGPTSQRPGRGGRNPHAYRGGFDRR